MILLGTAGTGTSYTVSAISKNLQERTSPTAKAAFLIKGKNCNLDFSKLKNLES